MTTISPEAIAAYPMPDGCNTFQHIQATVERAAFDRGRSLHLAATREALAKALFIAHISDKSADTAPAIWALCDEAADALLAPGGPIQLVSDVQAAQRTDDPRPYLYPDGSRARVEYHHTHIAEGGIFSPRREFYADRSTDPTGSTEP